MDFPAIPPDERASVPDSLCKASYKGPAAGLPLAFTLAKSDMDSERSNHLSRPKLSLLFYSFWKFAPSYFRPIRLQPTF
ncbi:hypothetical protein CfE428DRAFT_3999 [Chthoniobacter flavus Ellin428]|uniref:Uncharacterized protein n=1 Tax=Chthoniobacter flavus Ellin428 TaxID=497964 RepID=B4D510_9BACT|nr:hypothetical protein [Chthoniobacter flavus]EDY18613.1 hypothetical protein CfE428DRAFT_3999 [Chthoniobacter flavus Ellin428]TCO90931.1 hypothetical protein EV701_10980 [Chthoniobacter flavus]